MSRRLSLAAGLWIFVIAAPKFVEIGFDGFFSVKWFILLALSTLGGALIQRTVLDDD